MTRANSSTWPMIDQVEVRVTPDDGSERSPHSIQVQSDAKVRLTWHALHAKSVRIEPLGKKFGASGATDLPASDAEYTLIASGEDGQESLPYPLAVHTHEPGEVYSQHAEVAPPAKQWVIGFGIHH